MDNFIGILGETPSYREIIAYISSIDTSDNLEVLAIQERVHQTQERIRQIYNGSSNVFQLEQINRSSAEENTLQGTAFVKDHILSDVTEKTLILFKDLEPSIYIFILTKAVYLFTLGNKSKDQIPDFFKPDTKERIKNQDKEHIASKLQEIMKDFSEFEDVEESAINSVLTCLKGIAYEEIHKGLLATKCLTDALSDSKYQDI